MSRRSNGSQKSDILIAAFPTAALAAEVPGELAALDACVNSKRMKVVSIRLHHAGNRSGTE
jgi:hypothetical protein